MDIINEFINDHKLRQCCQNERIKALERKIDHIKDLIKNEIFLSEEILKQLKDISSGKITEAIFKIYNPTTIRNLQTLLYN